ncbi:amino acid ABC transporter permease [Vermiphilus pyriformis]|nr:MAG: amino acid ABC transporter permease [Vermiphilus pyriformis]
MINVDLIVQSLPALMRGAVVTLKIATLCTCIGIVLGTLLGVGSTSSNRLITSLINAYVLIIRGTPMLIQIFISFYVLPQIGIKLAPFWAATIALGLNSSAYLSQIIKAGITSVPRGQLDAAYVLGLSKWQTFRYITMPQALTLMLPALGNELVTLIKDSSLASTIGVVELSREGSFIQSRTLDALSIYLAVGMIYLALTITVSYFIHLYQKRMKTHAQYN